MSNNKTTKKGQTKKKAELVNYLLNWNEDGQMQNSIDRAYSHLFCSKEFEQMPNENRETEVLMFRILQETIREAQRIELNAEQENLS